MSQPIIIGGVIYHHGIFGQKWGKQNGPPYPLNESDHSAAEKKHFKVKINANEKELESVAKIKRRKNYAAKQQLKSTKNRLRAEKARTKMAVNAKNYKYKYNITKNTAKTDEEKDKKLYKLDNSYNKKQSRLQNKINRLEDNAIKNEIASNETYARVEKQVQKHIKKYGQKALIVGTRTMDAQYAKTNRKVNKAMAKIGKQRLKQQRLNR